MIMNSVADMIMKEMGQQSQPLDLEGVDQNDVQRIGEELFSEKIKSIFDEVAKERDNLLGS